MRRALLLMVAAGLLADPSVGVALNGHATAGGSSETYSGTACSQFLDGEDVYVFAGTTQAEQEATVAEPFGLLDTAGAVVGSALCTQTWRLLFCRATFPLPYVSPTTGTVLPRPLCQAACTNLHSVDLCEAGFSLINSVGYGAHVMQCNDVVGDEVRKTSYMYPNFLLEWNGGPQFPSSSQATASDGPVPCFDPINGGGAMMCPRKTCIFPYVEVSRATEGDDHSACLNYTQTEVDCGQCTSNCEVLCPLPVYTDGAFSLMWVVRWLPPLLALPLNYLVVANELNTMFHKDKKKRKFANQWVFITGVLGIAYTMLDAVPSLFMKNKLGCGGEETYSALESVGTEFGDSACTVLRFNVHIMQAMFASVGVTLQQLYMRLSAASKMRNYKPPLHTKVIALLYVFALPLALLVAHAASPIDNGMSNIPQDDGTIILRNLENANQLRYAHSCGPRFETIGEEWAIVLVPFILLGAVLVIVSGMLLSVTVGMIRAASSKKSDTVNVTQLNLAKTMLKFAGFCVFLVALNIGALVPFLNGALEFAYDITLWQQCAVTGINPSECTSQDISQCPRETDLRNETLRLERCGPYNESAPPSEFIVLLNLTYSAPPAIFGFLFGSNLLKAWIKEKRHKHYVAPAESAQ